MRISKEQEKRLSDLAASTVVGGDIAAVLAEVHELRELERSYCKQLGEIARLSDTVCTWVAAQFNESENTDVPNDIMNAAEEIMEYVEAVRP